MGETPVNRLSAARWAAAGFLGGASLVGMLWTTLGRAPAPPTLIRQVSTPLLAATDPYPTLPPRAAPADPGRAAPIVAVPLAVPPAAPPAAPFEPPAAAAAALPMSPVPQAGAADLSPAADPAPKTTPAPALERLNINTATAAELELLPGIGPTLAGRIIEFRDSRGAIRSFRELTEVRGIGERTAEKLAAYIRFE